MSGAPDAPAQETFGAALARATPAPRVVPVLIALNAAAVVALALAGEAGGSSRIHCANSRLSHSMAVKPWLGSFRIRRRSPVTSYRPSTARAGQTAAAQRARPSVQRS